MTRTAGANLTIYSLAHGLIDCACIAIIFRLFQTSSLAYPVLASLVLLYNVLAFAWQPVFGLMVDHWQKPRAAAVIGAGLTGLALLTFYYSPVWAIVFAGLGNALFHVGGGAISLGIWPGRAAAPGIFVAPGAVGLFIGAMLGGGSLPLVWPLFLLLVIFVFSAFAIKPQVLAYQQPPALKLPAGNFSLIFGLVFFTIVVRSLLGSVIILPWKSIFIWSIILIMAIFAGKIFGGIIGDRYGWKNTAALALILAIPLLGFGAYNPALAIIGMMLVNITMPLTLTAMSNILPNHPAFAFGLTCLALTFGYLPSFLTIKSQLNSPWVIASIIGLAAVALYFAFSLYEKKYLKLNNQNL